MYFVALRVLGCGLGLILTLGSGAREMPIFVQRTCTISGDFFYQYPDFVGVGVFFFLFPDFVAFLLCPPFLGGVAFCLFQGLQGMVVLFVMHQLSMSSLHCRSITSSMPYIQSLCAW